MRKLALATVLLGLGLVTDSPADETVGDGARVLPVATHYSLSYRVFPEEERLEAHVTVSIENPSDKAVTDVPFLLYRLLRVDHVSGDDGSPLPFVTDIVSDTDTPELQVNRVDVTLAEPLGPEETTSLTLGFAGPIYGYDEVWGYVHDTISEEYSLLRKDSFAYPLLSLPNSASRFRDQRFSYDLEVTVPDGYVVASGGRPTGVESADGHTTFFLVSKVPVWRLDIAVADFSVRRSDDGALAVFVLPGHEEGADRVLQAIRDSVDLYSELFGPVGDFLGYTAIEIPNGWGSQAADLYFLQTAAAFEDPERLGEVYHEVSHNWSPEPRAEVQRCRYFDEAFGSYFETLAKRAFEGEEAWLAAMEFSRDLFVRWAQHDKAYYETPIVEYGSKEFGHLSYNKGAWSLYVLHRLIGEEAFRQLVRRLLADSAEHPIGFEDFERAAREISGRDLDRFFDEWLRGVESSRLLVEAVPIAEILTRYE